MKSFYSLLIILLVTSFSFSQQGWYQQSSGTTNYLYAVQFVDQNTGWVVGQASTVLKTTNSGVNWFPQNPNAPGFLYALFFIDANTGWVVGQSGAIRKTTNGGVNWTPQVSGFSQNYIYSVCFTDVNFGYICGSGGLILKTSNGGTNWVQMTSNVTNTLSCIFFPPSATSMVGFASGGTASEGTILKTENAGNNWILQTLGSNWLFGIYFTNVQEGWTVGFNGTIYSTANGGTNWISQSSGTTNRLVAVSFPNSTTGYAVGYSGSIVKTTNGGINWFSQQSPSANNFWGTYFLDDNTGWAAGWNGTILKTTNGGVTYVNNSGTEIPAEFKLYQNYPNPFNPVTKIKFDVPVNVKSEKSNVKISVFDILGKEIAAPVNWNYRPGSYEVTWNASAYPSGVYFYRLIAGKFRQTKAMILIK